MITLGVAQIALTAGLLLAAGCGVIAAISLIASKKPLAADLFQSLLSMVIVAGTLFLIFLVGDFALVPFFLVLGVRVGFESAHVHLGPNSAMKGAMAGGVLTALTMWQPMIAIGFGAVWCLLLARFFSMPHDRSRPLWKMGELLLFPLLPTAILGWAALDPTMRPLVLVVYILIETFDSYALVAGKLFGRTLAFPVLSPRKTIEGLAGGAICLMLTALAAAWVLDLNPALSAATALIVGIIAVAGDLAASRLKRSAGVKDYPVVLPKQGGILDIADSWIAAGAAVGMLHFLLSVG